jgi:hypothetical protein
MYAIKPERGSRGKETISVTRHTSEIADDDGNLQNELASIAKRQTKDIRKRSQLEMRADANQQRGRVAHANANQHEKNHSRNNAWTKDERK